MNLAEWQKQFTYAINDESIVFEKSLFLSDIGPKYKQAIAAYKNNYQGSRLEALKEIYPICIQSLGEKCFNGLANLYVKENISQEPDLNLYGNKFDQLLKKIVNKEAGFSPYPWLANLASLEYACHQVYYFSNPIAFDDTILKQVDITKIKVTSARHIAFLTLEWDLLNIWLAQQNGSETQELIVDNDQNYILIERKNFKAKPEIISKDLYLWLEAAKLGGQLSVLLENKYLTPACLSDLVLHGWLEMEVIDV